MTEPMGYILAEGLGAIGWNLLGASRAMLPIAEAVRAFNRRAAETPVDRLQLIPVYGIGTRPIDGTAHACPCSDAAGYFVPLDVDLNRPGHVPMEVDAAGLWPVGEPAEVGASGWP